MVMRNAFEEMATERTMRLILAAVSYARDINDRLRVTVDNQVSTTVSAGPYMNGSASAGTARLLYDVNATFTVDDRDEMRAATQHNARAARQRWTYS